MRYACFAAILVPCILLSGAISSAAKGGTLQEYETCIKKKKTQSLKIKTVKKFCMENNEERLSVYVLDLMGFGVPQSEQDSLQKRRNKVKQSDGLLSKALKMQEETNIAVSLYNNNYESVITTVTIAMGRTYSDQECVIEGLWIEYEEIWNAKCRASDFNLKWDASRDDVASIRDEVKVKAVYGLRIE